MNTEQPLKRDERTVAVENASYKWTCIFLLFALLIDVMYRSRGSEGGPLGLTGLGHCKFSHRHDVSSPAEDTWTGLGTGRIAHHACRRHRQVRHRSHSCHDHLQVNLGSRVSSDFPRVGDVFNSYSVLRTPYRTASTEYKVPSTKWEYEASRSSSTSLTRRV